MKKLIILLTCLFTLNVFAQDDKTVTLVVSGQGKTQDEARQNALRSAIEQSFGTFISSKAEMLNDNLIKDEIVSISNGNIKKYEPISEVKMPDGNYASTLRASVSISKLTTFCESKGVAVEFKGASFGMNLKLKQLNAESEYKAIQSLCNVSKDILTKSLDYEINANDPEKDSQGELFNVELNVTAKTNKNLKIFYEYFWKSIRNICLSENEIEDYKKLKLDLYPFYSYQSASSIDVLYLRNIKSLDAIIKLFLKSNYYLVNFKVESELGSIVPDKNLSKWVFDIGEGKTNAEKADYASRRNSFKPHPVDEMLFRKSFPSALFAIGIGQVGKTPVGEPLMNYCQGEETLLKLFVNKEEINLNIGTKPPSLVIYTPPSKMINCEYSISHVLKLSLTDLSKISEFKIKKID